MDGRRQEAAFSASGCPKHRKARPEIVVEDVLDIHSLVLSLWHHPLSCPKP